MLKRVCNVAIAGTIVLLVTASSATAAPTAYVKAVLAAKPVAYWQFADAPGSSTYADTVLHGPSLAAGATSLFAPGVAGTDGAVLAAGGTGTASALAPLVGDAERTLELWFKAPSTYGCLLTAGSQSHAQAFSLCVGHAPANSPVPGLTSVYLQTWDSDVLVPVSNLTDGAWHYLGLTLKGGEVDVVVDGLQPIGYVWNGSSYSYSTAQPFTLPNTPNTASSPLGVATAGWIGGLAGDIDEVAVYPTALTIEDLIHHYQFATSPLPWKLKLLPAAQVIRAHSVADVYATLTDSLARPIPNVDVTLGVTIGPDIGKTFKATTNSSGRVFWEVEPTGTDTLQAGTEPPAGHLVQSNTAKVSLTTASFEDAIGALSMYDPVAKVHHFCTAVVVPSWNESTVVTAGHCVYGSGQYFTEFQFIPKYRGDCLNACREPFGVFEGNTAFTLPLWQQSGDHSEDLGVIVLGVNKNGLKVQRAVHGGLAVEADPTDAQEWRSFGYPGTPRLASCHATAATTQDVDSGLQFFIPCSTLGEGASGGPWLTNETKVGAVNSLASKSCLICQQEQTGTILSSQPEFELITKTGRSGL
jgi:V8-like Glu-specific endopeptidase